MAVLNEEKRLLKTDFANDLKNLLLKQFEQNSIKSDPQLPLETIVRQYFNLQLRSVQVKPRAVHWSKELLAKILLQEITLELKTLHKRIEEGWNITGMLSKQVLDPNAKDMLLYDLGIHHLHLSSYLKPGEKFVQRTKELLYVRFTDTDAYFVDVLDHNKIDGFANRNLLEIMNRNWPDLLISIGGLLPPNETMSNSDIHQARKAGILPMHTTTDKKVHFSPGGGFATSGDFIIVTRQTGWLIGTVHKVEKWVQENESLVRQQIEGAIHRKTKNIDLRFISWGSRDVTIREIYSMYEFKLHINNDN